MGGGGRSDRDVLQNDEFGFELSIVQVISRPTISQTFGICGNHGGQNQGRPPQPAHLWILIDKSEGDYIALPGSLSVDLLTENATYYLVDPVGRDPEWKPY